MDRESYTDLHLPESSAGAMGQNATRRIGILAREHAPARVRGGGAPSGGLRAATSPVPVEVAEQAVV
jgi:hypothetical protein